jgi:hypothetical protein
MKLSGYNASHNNIFDRSHGSAVSCNNNNHINNEK